MVRPEIQKAALGQISQENWVRLELMKRSGKIPLVLTLIRVRVDVVRPVAAKLNADYGLIDREEELVKTLDLVEGQDGYPVLWSVMKRLRRRLNQPVYTAHNMGYGLGIKKLHLTPSDAITLYVLRRNRGQRMSAEDIAGELYDEVDSKKVVIVRHSVDRLRDKPAHGQTFQIETRGRYANKGYEYLEMNGKR